MSFFCSCSQLYFEHLWTNSFLSYAELCLQWARFSHCPTAIHVATSSWFPLSEIVVFWSCFLIPGSCCSLAHFSPLHLPEVILDFVLLTTCLGKTGRVINIKNTTLSIQLAIWRGWRARTTLWLTCIRLFLDVSVTRKFLIYFLWRCSYGMLQIPTWKAGSSHDTYRSAWVAILRILSTNPGHSGEKVAAPVE